MEIDLGILIEIIVVVLLLTCYLCCRELPVTPPDDNNNNENEEQPQPNVGRITIVRPMPLGTAVQVKVEKIRYDKCTDDENSKYDCCSICLENYRSKEQRATIHACSHRFHAGCIESWLQTNDNCPLCRHHLV